MQLHCCCCCCCCYCWALLNYGLVSASHHQFESRL